MADAFAGMEHAHSEVLHHTNDLQSMQTWTKELHDTAVQKIKRHTWDKYKVLMCLDDLSTGKGECPDLAFKNKPRQFNYQTVLQDQASNPLMWIALDHTPQEGYVVDIKFVEHPGWQNEGAEDFQESTLEMSRTIFREGAW